MSVRAKFKCTSNKPGSDGTADILLEAVYSSDPESENAAFFKYTPSGSIRIGCVNPSANAQFIEGKEYYVDFTPAE